MRTADMDCTASESQEATTQAVVSEFFSEVMKLAAAAQQRLSGACAAAGGSRCLGLAAKAGLEPQAAYSVLDTSRYSGVPKSTLYREHQRGRLAWVMPRGQQRGAYITVEEMDRWMEENTD